MRIRNSSGEIFSYATMEQNSQNREVPEMGPFHSTSSSTNMNNGGGSYGSHHWFSVNPAQATPQQTSQTPITPPSHPRYFVHGPGHPGSFYQPSGPNIVGGAPSPQPQILAERLGSRTSASMDLDSREQTPTLASTFSNLPLVGDAASAAMVTPGNGNERICVCGTGQNNLRNGNSAPIFDHKHGIRIESLLNSPPPVGLQSNAQPFNLATPTSTNQPTPNHEPFASSSQQTQTQDTRSQAPSASSSISIFMSTETQTSLQNLAEERSHLLSTLYWTCFDATEEYISALPRRRSRHTSRVHPYSHALRTRNSSSGRNTSPGRAPSLMDNIATISAHLWGKARNDIMAPHREEAVAVRDMGKLYNWGEAVVRGCEGEGREREEEVGQAASRVCDWLGDGDRVEICDEIWMDLDSFRDAEGEAESEGECDIR